MLAYLRYVLGVDTIDRVADVLPGGDEEGEAQEGYHCNSSVTCDRIRPSNAIIHISKGSQTSPKTAADASQPAGLTEQRG